MTKISVEKARIFLENHIAAHPHQEGTEPTRDEKTLAALNHCGLRRCPFLHPNITGDQRISLGCGRGLSPYRLYGRVTDDYLGYDHRCLS